MYSKRSKDEDRIKKAKEMLLKGYNFSQIGELLELNDVRGFFKHNARSFSKIRFIKREVAVDGQTS